MLSHIPGGNTGTATMPARKQATNVIMKSNEGGYTNKALSPLFKPHPSTLSI